MPCVPSHRSCGRNARNSHNVLVYHPYPPVPPQLQKRGMNEEYSAGDTSAQAPRSFGQGWNGRNGGTLALRSQAQDTQDVWSSVAFGKATFALWPQAVWVALNDLLQALSEHYPAPIRPDILGFILNSSWPVSKPSTLDLLKTPHSCEWRTMVRRYQSDEPKFDSRARP